MQMVNTVTELEHVPSILIFLAPFVQNCSHLPPFLLSHSHQQQLPQKPIKHTPINNLQSSDK